MEALCFVVLPFLFNEGLMIYSGIVIEVATENCPNAYGKVPFVDNKTREHVHYIKFKEHMPVWYVHNKKLWKLISGKGSTYYIPSSKRQVLPMFEDGPWKAENA